MPPRRKQNLTVSLSMRTIQQAKVLAAKRATTISGLLEQQIADLVGQGEAYENSFRRALSLMDQGLRLGGDRMAPRDTLHER